MEVELPLRDGDSDPVVEGVVSAHCVGETFSDTLNQNSFTVTGQARNTLLGCRRPKLEANHWYVGKTQWDSLTMEVTLKFDEKLIMG